MMKNNLLLLLAAALTVTMISCSQQEETADPSVSTEPAAVETTGETQASADGRLHVADDGCLCELDNGVSIRLGMKLEEVRDTLGTVTDRLEAPSCLYDGVDQILTIDGAYTVTVVQAADGEDRITELSFLSDAVALKAGNGLIMIGSAEQDLTNAFGEPTESAFGVQKFPIDGGMITAGTSEGYVTSLTVTYSGD